MGIHAVDVRELIVRPTLEQLNEWSPAAENLLIGTAAQESQLGFRLHTSTLNGLGMYRISAQTHIQVWDEFLITDPELASRLRGLASQQQFLKSPHTELITNLSYATGVAWMIYKRHQLALPDPTNIRELAKCWFKYYLSRSPNPLDSHYDAEQEIAKFDANYRKLVLRENKKLAA